MRAVLVQTGFRIVRQRIDPDRVLNGIWTLKKRRLCSNISRREVSIIGTFRVKQSLTLKVFQQGASLTSEAGRKPCQGCEVQVLMDNGPKVWIGKTSFLT